MSADGDEGVRADGSGGGGSEASAPAAHDHAHTSRPPSDSEDVPADGRSLRRVRNRAKVVDAYLDMVASGHRGPSIEELANYSGVSLRSIYRYFGSTTELLEAAVDRGYEIVSPMLAIPGLGEGPLDERIERLVDNRIELHRRVSEFTEAARATHSAEPPVIELYATIRSLIGRQISAHFAPELAGLDHDDRKAKVTSIYFAFMHDSMSMLFSVFRDDPDRVRALLVDHVQRHLAPPPEAWSSDDPGDPGDLDDPDDGG